MATMTPPPLDMPPLLDSDTDYDDDPNAHSESDLPPLLQDSTDDEAEEDTAIAQQHVDNNETEEQRTLRLYALLSSKSPEELERRKAERKANKAKLKKGFEAIQQEILDQEEKERQREAKESKRVARHAQKEAKKRARKAQEEQELMETCTENLRRGFEHYVAADYKNALSPLQFVEKSMGISDSSRYKVISKSVNGDVCHIIRYMTLRCAFETDYEATREKHLLSSLDQLLHDFPVSFVYWLYGRAMNKYQPKNEQTETVLSRASALLCELKTEDFLLESNATRLEKLIDEELQIWQRRPAPDGVCNSSACSNSKIYWGDDGPLCARITCSHGHSLLYHKSCWRNVCKKVYGSISRDQVISEMCPLATESCDDCAGTIAQYDDLTNTGAVRSSYEAPTAVSSLCEKGEGLSPVSVTQSEEYAVENERDRDEHGDDYREKAGLNESNNDPVEKIIEHVQHRPLVDAFTVDISNATIILPREPTQVKNEPLTKKKRKEKATMSLGEFWKTEEAKEAAREEERRALKAQLPEFERNLNDLHHTVKMLARRPTKKLTLKSEERK